MTSHSQPLVSVVTPVYNGEKYIAVCIESVLKQSYVNWEYIIVNNCSTDQTQDIVRKYVEQDARIRIHNNDRFLDIMQNWNHAVHQISPNSKYCKILLADDVLFPNCIEQLVAVAERNPSVGMVGSYVLTGDQVACDGLPFPDEIIPGKEVCRRNLLQKPYVFLSQSSLLIRADIISAQNDYYPEPNIQGDVESCYRVLQKSDFGFVHQVLAYIRVHDDSVTSKMALPMRTYLLANLDMMLRYGRIFLDNGEYEKALKHRLGIYYKFLGNSLLERRNKKFWRYQKQEFRKLGFRLNWMKIFITGFREFLARIFNRVWPA